MFPQVSANTRIASSIETFSQLGGILGVGYRGIDFAPPFSVESRNNTPGAMPAHDGLGPAQRRHELGATLHGATRTACD
jgi:hypothetical protein